jgi:hypothetical protein
MISLLLTTVLFGAIQQNGQNELGWSEEAFVLDGREPVVRFQARLQGGYLIVRARHESGWHTYAMDNEARAKAALKGKPSLGIEQGLAFQVEKGLELGGQWLQSKPQDLSKPELRWYTYGFERVAWFVCPVKKVTSEQIVLRIRGQACSGETCSQIDTVVRFPSSSEPPKQRTTSDDEKIKALLSRLMPVESKQRADREQLPVD